MRLLLIALLFSNYAYADRDFAVKGLNQANTTLLGTPALPSLHGPNNKFELAIKGATFSAKTDTPKDQAINDGGYVNFEGTGFAFLLHKYFSKNFGYFFVGAGNQLSGEAESNFGGNSVQAKNVNSDMYQVGGGFSYTLGRNRFLPIQLFAGPSFTSTTLRQTITSGSGDDFDMESSTGVMTYFVGMQLGIYLSSWLAINPYFITGDLLSEEDRCQSFKSTARSTGNLWDFSDPQCQEGQNSSTSKMYYDPSFSIFGLNILIPRWNLSINVHTSAEEIEGFQDAPIDMFSISLTL